jgi:hypothetical protein
LQEHKANIRNGKLDGNLLAQHAWDSGHTILFGRADILLKERNFERRKIKEALIMKAYGSRCLSRPSRDVQTFIPIPGWGFGHPRPETVDRHYCLKPPYIP